MYIVSSLAPAISSALKGLRSESRGLDVVQTQADELLPLKNKLDELRKRVKEFKRAINDLLSNDEDLCMICLLPPTDNEPLSDIVMDTKIGENEVNIENLSTKRKSRAAIKTETIALEMLFEVYLNEVEWISAEIEEIVDEVTNTEENVVLNIDLLRNRILRFELVLSVATFVITCGALVTGLFGMNLLSHFELNGAAFYVVTASLVTFMTSTFLGILKYGRREKLF
jgi:magnesium transporter